MNILVINASPKKKKSNTMLLTNAFIENKENVKVIDVYSQNIKQCGGCFECWKNGGSCLIDDDMKEIITSFNESEIIIFSFPLYFFSLPGKLKTVIDRLLPIVVPFNGRKANTNDSVLKAQNKKIVIISTSGFCYEESLYNGVFSIFDHLVGDNNYTKIITGQGELLGYLELEQIYQKKLSAVKRASELYFKDFKINKKTENEINANIVPVNIFNKLANLKFHK